MPPLRLQLLASGAPPDERSLRRHQQDLLQQISTFRLPIARLRRSRKSVPLAARANRQRLQHFGSMLLRRADPRASLRPREQNHFATEGPAGTRKSRPEASPAKG